MNFELNDVASSSSSSQDSDEDRSGSSSCDHEVDEGLAYEVRTALHLNVGKICRAEDEKESSADGNTNPSFTMNKEAIVALTDLTYHYSTSLLAKDLLTFSKHAKRQTVKTDDVLLMARKDKGMAAELKRIMADNPDIYTDATKKKSKRGNSGAAQMRKNNIAKSNDKRSTLAKFSKNSFLWIFDEEIQDAFNLKNNDEALDMKLLQMFRLYDKTLSASLFAEINVEN